MVKIEKIYTRSGDKGQTSLGNGARVLKSDMRIKAIGDIDELNAFLGWTKTKSERDDIKQIIANIQNDLFDVGADLCIPQENIGKLQISQKQVSNLEQLIDKYNENLPTLYSFMIPGSQSQAEASLHIARTVCRRAERTITALMQHEPLNPFILSYINRLSDILFVFIRIIGDNNVLWEKGKNI